MPQGMIAAKLDEVPVTMTIDERRELLARHSLSEDKFAEIGLQWDVLEEIRASHEAETSDLRDSAEYIYKRLLTVPEVHSLKLRVKDPDHLVEKIVRKKLENPELEITADNYREHITDLIGIRALHLFKEQWQPIHDFVMQTWGRDLLHEGPRAYIREGDAGPVIDAQKVACDVQEHPFGYRSVHYLIRSQPAKVTRITELQVRTLFEEGWSEIDHQVRYPKISDDPLLGDLTVIFNRLAGSADEMGAFIKILSNHLREQSVRQVEAQKQLALTEEKLNKLILQSKASDKEKEELRREVTNLRQQQVTFSTGGLGLMSDFGKISSATLDVGKIGSSLSLGKISSATLDVGRIGSLVTFADRPRNCSECGQLFTTDSISSTALVVESRCPSCRTKSFAIKPPK